LLKATWHCIARFGRFVDITKIDTEADRRLEMDPFRRCATYANYDLLQQTRFRGHLTQEALVNSLRIILQRKAPPMHPITPYPISEMAAAMRRMQGGTHVGKLVLVSSPGDKVKVVSRLPPLQLADNDATYLVAGGLTGIGLAITRWMMGKGARNLLLVSRNATCHPAAAEVKEEARLAGCRVEIRDCDLADEGSLGQLVHDCSKVLLLPPIRGVINGAMVLDDTVMERMTFEQWRNAIRPKIDSSRNLDKLLPDLSFYIMLSSVAGVAGHTSQANYAAGNTFEDALARHRTAQGKPAVAIDLCAVRSAGYVEASGDDRLRAHVENTGVGFVDVETVLRLVEAAIRDPLRKSPADCQVIVGLDFNAFPQGSTMRHDPRLGTLRLAAQRGVNMNPAAQSSSNKSATAALIQSLSGVSSMAEAASLLQGAIAAKLADIFNIPLPDIDVDLPLSRYGVDSLVAVELRNWLTSSLKSKVSVFETLQSASITEFAALVAERSEYLSCKGLGVL
jgi:NADP-dependent 3-hydroxy acid dehydrogenase YdfG